MRHAKIFNAADSANIETTYNEFNESLVKNTLFGERMLINDTLFFNNPNIITHLNQADSNTLFEAACRDGIILPMLKEPVKDSFSQVMKQWTGIYGSSYNVLHEGMTPILQARIIGSIDQAFDDGIQPYIWPRDISIGAGYLTQIDQRLRLGEPGVLSNEAADSKLRQLWNDTERWRHDIIERAIISTNARGHVGIQRAEILNQLGWSLGVPPGETVTIQNLLERVRPDQRDLVITFMRWVSHCKHANEALISETDAHYPKLDLDSDVLIEDGLSHRDNARLVSAIFEETIVLPPLGELARLDPGNLIAIRREHSSSYLSSMRQWIVTPSESNALTLRTCLQSYAEKIRERYRKAAVEKAFVSIYPARFKQGFDFGEKSLMGAASLMGFGTYVAVISLGLLVINFARGVTKNRSEMTNEKIELTSDHIIVP